MAKFYRAIADYYDAENARHLMLDQDVPFFLGQLPNRRQSILEIAVGTARAAIPMAQAGHRVVGVDFDPSMLAVARRKRDAVGLGDKQLSLVHDDALDLDLGTQFDWACIFFNTFLGFTELDRQDRLLRGIRRHLRPRGRLWLDIFNPDLSMLAREAATNLDPTSFYVPQFDRTVSMVTDIRRLPSQVQRVTFRYTWFDAAGREHRQRTEFDMTYLFPRELQILLERNGFKIEHLFGNYDGSTVSPDSPRLIARAILHT